MKNLSLSFWLLLVTINIAYALQSPIPVYKKGLVVSAHPEASKVGLEILKYGGNAIDAAVAVQFALAVVYPNAGNIGGGGFMVYRDYKGATSTLDFREKAPIKAYKDMYLDNSGNPIKEKSIYGRLSCGVPGTVDGMVNAHLKYGKLNWQNVLQPAINLAKNGFSVTKDQAEELNGQKKIFEKYNPEGTDLVKNTKWVAGDILKQPELAHTLELIKTEGRAGFYAGEIAALIVKETNKEQGIISLKDLESYQSIWRKPIVGKYKDYTLITMPPPSSGGIALMQLLHSVEPYPIAKWGQNKDSTVRLLVEAARRVYADRSEYLGDPDFYKVPQNALLNYDYQQKRMENMNWDKATLSSDIKPGELINESEETTHFSIVDKKGNAVSITTTLNGSYGSKVIVKGAGFLLNNEMDDFSVKAGSPNMYGVTGGTANEIEPGKRMLSSMTPTIIEKDKKLFMVLGTPGGSTIITSVFQTILNVIEFKQDMQTAVNSKRFHHQWLPDEVFTEEDVFDVATQQKLKEKGYVLTLRGNIGRVDAILKTKKGYQGGADPRGDDTTAGY
ncbi:gamma-glutamyltransferase [Pedobacter alpinus]|uniref:Glutathione hydrolase proenzyme n=1 Tax=Pedobacter alpinus TaxID=1590643 RepID=A0ABW5TPC3_9SPHI